MIRHFFIDKTNTIIKGSERNLGRNPILCVGYGNYIMRGLIHFDVENIKKLILDKTFADTSKLKITLKMTNCFSVDEFSKEKTLLKGLDVDTKRASSFDLMLCKLPLSFDAGRGFDYSMDFWENNKQSYINEGSNWFCCTSGVLWDGSLRPEGLHGVEGGIWDMDTLESEYNKFLNNEESIVIGTQHFDFGNENLSINITKYVMDCISSKRDINHGLCLLFTPTYEKIKRDEFQCVDFFTDNTNTFFHPFLEVLYNDYIFDDRESFTVNKENKLYLYVSDDGEMTNLDVLPVCRIGETVFDVKQSTKGVYYAVISPENKVVVPNTIEYDSWSNIALNGVKMEDVELEFETKNTDNKIKIGSNSNLKRDVVPSFYGINDDEKIKQGDIREITVDFRTKFNTEKKELITSGEYRLYVKDGNREIDVIDYQPIEKTFLNNFFIIYTEDLIPNRYYIDIKVRIGRETKYFKNALRFKIVDNVTERYQ